MGVAQEALAWCFRLEERIRGLACASTLADLVSQVEELKDRVADLEARHPDSAQKAGGDE